MESPQGELLTPRDLLLREFHIKIALHRAHIDSTKELPSKLLSTAIDNNSPMMIHSITTPLGPTNNQNGIQKEFLQFYQDLFQSKPCTLSMNLERTSQMNRRRAKMTSSPLSIIEISNVLSTVKKTSPGPDGIPYTLYRRCPSALNALHSLFKLVWDTGIVLLS